MDHETFESQMFDSVNRHADEAGDQPVLNTPDNLTKGRKITNEKDARVLSRGIARTVLALVTAVTVGVSVVGFIEVAKATGYLAVLLFIASLLTLVISGTLLYAQGIDAKTHKGSEGTRK
jgi:hypothetical protein